MVPGTVLGIFHILIHLMLTKAYDKCRIILSIDEQTEAQRG